MRSTQEVQREQKKVRREGERVAIVLSAPWSLYIIQRYVTTLLSLQLQPGGNLLLRLFHFLGRFTVFTERRRKSNTETEYIHKDNMRTGSFLTCCVVPSVLETSELLCWFLNLLKAKQEVNRTKTGGQIPSSCHAKQPKQLLPYLHGG